MGLVYNPIHNRKDNMITQIILRFKDLPEKDRRQICHNLLIDTNVFLATNTDYKVFYKEGGINKPMIEVKDV